MDLELRPQLPLLAVRYATLECSPERRQKKNHPQVVVFALCWLLYRARSSVLSPCCHGRVGQEPVTGGDSSVDEFWESCGWSRRATDLLRAGWYPVFVRHHPDSSLLSYQDRQCKGRCSEHKGQEEC